MSVKPDILFLSHGGGPMPLLGDPLHAEMVTCLQNIARDIEIPAAILLISAHWETESPQITAAPNPELIYDYYGFPEESYAIRYPCPGNPALAEQVRDILSRHHIHATLNAKRGYDHGLFVPLKIMYPQADIPCIQLSLLSSLDAREHLNLGKALQGLQHDKLLVIGSGFSFHNLRAFFSKAPQERDEANEAFETWLMETISNKELDEDSRRSALINWEQAPAARYCHPREEHLLPLHVCYGMAQTACTQAYALNIFKKQASMYLWKRH